MNATHPPNKIMPEEEGEEREEEEEDTKESEEGEEGEGRSSGEGE